MVRCVSGSSHSLWNHFELISIRRINYMRTCDTHTHTRQCTVKLVSLLCAASSFYGIFVDCDVRYFYFVDVNLHLECVLYSVSSCALRLFQTKTIDHLPSHHVTWDRNNVRNERKTDRHTMMSWSRDMSFKWTKTKLKATCAIWIRVDVADRLRWNWGRTAPSCEQRDKFRKVRININQHHENSFCLANGAYDIEIWILAFFVLRLCCVHSFRQQKTFNPTFVRQTCSTHQHFN